MITAEDKEQDLVRMMQHDSIRGMKAFYTRYCGYLTAVCLRYIADKDDAKDVLQESFISIYKAIGKFHYQGSGSLKAWSAKIVVNQSIKHLREKKKFNFISHTEIPDVVDNDPPDFESIPQSVITQMIQELPAGYRTVFNLYVFEQKSHKEIAQLLKIAENSSASQYHRAKAQLIKKANAYREKQ